MVRPRSLRPRDAASLPRLALVAALSSGAAGCAAIASEVAGELLGACLEVGARAACATLCDDDGGDDDEGDPDDDESFTKDAPRPPRQEPPPPDWEPAVADCELRRDEAGVHVDCAGGTRALFLPHAELAPAAPREARSPTVRGPVEIVDPVDVGRLAGTRAIEGSLVLRSQTLVSLVAPELQSVGGDLTVSGAPALERLALPALATVGGAVLIVDNPRLPQGDAEELVFRLTRHGFSGPVDAVGNAPPAP